jgi:hypothetical protein
MIGAKVAFGLYGLLVVVAMLTLHGTPRVLALVIVLGLAAKTLVDLLRRRMNG